MQIVCYELARHQTGDPPATRELPATHAAFHACSEHMESALNVSDFAIGNADRIRDRLRAVLARSDLSEKDANTLSGLFRHLTERLRRGES